jgi:putative YhdH/YhfP family quinone oxidoreductase
MALGTAGFTAGLSVFRLSEIVSPGDGKIIVSGATGGVGSITLALLSRLGYETAAVTGKAEAAGYLKSLGAGEILLRSEFGGQESRPLLKTVYAGGIDTVGGPVLENIIKSVKPWGAVTCCGNVASEGLNLTVYPFILRGITLAGIDSQNCPMEHRKKIWAKFADEWKLEKLAEMVTEIGLEDVSGIIDQMLEGRIKGRYLIVHG